MTSRYTCRCRARDSTEEPLEQGRPPVGGEGGGKRVDQGERAPIPHAPDTARGSRVPGIGPRAKSRTRATAGAFTALLHPLTVDLLRDSF